MVSFLDKNKISSEYKELKLVNLLECSKKNRIKSIAERYGVKLTEKNTKQQMIEAALPAIEVNFGIKLKHYSKDDLSLAIKSFTEAEISEQLAEEVINSAPFADGAIYIIEKKDKLFAAIPHELAGKLMMQCVTQCFDNNSSEIERCAKACAAIYGCFTPKLLADAANSAYSTGITEHDAGCYLASADNSEFTFSDGIAVSSSCDSLQIMPEAAGMDYYIPTRGEIESYAAYGTDSHNYYYRQIVNFIFNYTGITYDTAKIILRNISDFCRTHDSLSVVFEMLEHSGMNLSADKYNYLLGMIGELNNHTRKPVIKGYTPEEVDGFKPVSVPIVKIAKAKRKPVRTEHKIGRNDPCPCGSGKKYKKCCGKNK